MSTHTQAEFISKHAAMQAHSQFTEAAQMSFIWDCLPQYSMTLRERMYTVATNVCEAAGRRHWDRQRLASEATLDIRTVNRIFNAQPVHSRSIARVATALGFTPQEIRLPYEDFLPVLYRHETHQERAAVAPTIEHAAERAPWWRRLLARIWR